MGYATINMNYKKAMAKADELDELAASIAKMASSELGGAMQVISNNWKGESADIFINKGMSLQNQIVSTSKKLKETAAAIRNIANRTRNAELRALELANKREYGGGNGGGGGFR